MIAKYKKSDLFLRVLSSIIMLFLGAFILCVGGTTFVIILTFISVMLAWEILSFSNQQNYIKVLGALFFAIIFAVHIMFSQILSLILLATFLLCYKVLIKHDDFIKRTIYFIIILFSLQAFTELRIEVGLTQTFWVICCVIASDIGGYFVGRSIGGPKLWPIISPKKTWSGIIGGWLLALITTYIFIILFNEIEWYFIFIAFFVSIFSQIGDLFESSLKRTAGIKDSSNFIPGHGGFLDRFDGMIGAFFAIYTINFLNINIWLF